MKRKELSKGTQPTSKEDSEGIDLLTSYMKEDETMGLNCDDDKFLRDTILNLMIAGRDTTSSALTWFIWLVSTHPKIQAKIRQELMGVNFGQNNIEEQNWRVFGAEETNKMVYLHGAICEALRLYPPVPFQHKAPVETVELPSGHRVHPKMKVRARGILVKIFFCFFTFFFHCLRRSLIIKGVVLRSNILRNIIKFHHRHSGEKAMVDRNLINTYLSISH